MEPNARMKTTPTTVASQSVNILKKSLVVTTTSFFFIIFTVRLATVVGVPAVIPTHSFVNYATILQLHHSDLPNPISAVETFPNVTFYFLNLLVLILDNNFTSLHWIQHEEDMTTCRLPNRTSVIQTFEYCVLRMIQSLCLCTGTELVPRSHTSSLSKQTGILTDLRRATLTRFLDGFIVRPYTRVIVCFRYCGRLVGAVFVISSSPPRPSSV